MKTYITLIAAIFLVAEPSYAQTGIVVYRGTATERVQTNEGIAGVRNSSSLAYLVVDYNTRTMGYVLTQADGIRGNNLFRRIGSFSVAGLSRSGRNLLCSEPPTATSNIVASRACSLFGSISYQASGFGNGDPATFSGSGFESNIQFVRNYTLVLRLDSEMAKVANSPPLGVIVEGIIPISMPPTLDSAQTAIRRKLNPNDATLPEYTLYRPKPPRIGTLGE